MRRVIILSVFLCCSCIAFAQQKDSLTLRVMSYNVENLFDYEHDSLKNDHEFLPDAERRWNRRKYKRKLNAIASVITAVGGWEAPALVGLCEVENERALTDLTKHSKLRRQGYRYVMTNSPDERGIDVALLYQPGSFRLVETQSIHVELPGGDATRDILHVVGQLQNLDTLDVFVCHFPSRSGGEKESEPKRLAAASILKQAVDSLVALRRDAKIIMMGDFNDYPENRSIREALAAEDAYPTLPAYRADKLYHLLAGNARGRHDYGSYRYRGEWGFLDHMIVTGNLLQPSSNLYTVPGQADVFRAKFLLEPDTRYGGDFPHRNYSGVKYSKKGYSDHLPIFADFRLLY
ncbi:MAG: endonuclease/exonuclease/phosphatase family protein [Bacteroidaceae bacterium]|nr:endonuclease/exonuclease/phosphatase family protein [Bacteroidaceae bacterium]